MQMYAMCVCVCVFERERETWFVCVHISLCTLMCVCEHDFVCLSGNIRLYEQSVCVCVHVCV